MHFQQTREQKDEGEKADGFCLRDIDFSVYPGESILVPLWWQMYFCNIQVIKGVEMASSCILKNVV